MRILFLHPYGSSLTDWNHRLKRQTELMAKKCELKVIGSHISPSKGVPKEWITRVKETIDKFKPDVVYISGFLLAHKVLSLHENIVYDMGAYKTRNILLNIHGITYEDIRKMTRKELISKAMWGRNAIYFEIEDKVIRKVKAIIIWESEEADLVRKIHKVVSKIHEISMLFYKLPRPIPWEKKKDRVVAVAAKWGERGKNGRLLSAVNEIIGIDSIGHGGTFARSLLHHELMDYVNNSKVVFCPFVCGGIGVINEGLRLGCNVVVGSWHPYLTYVNEELIVGGNKKVVDRSITIVKKALKQYYPPKPMPTEEEQIIKVINVCEKVAKDKW